MALQRGGPLWVQQEAYRRKDKDRNFVNGDTA